MCPVIVEPLLIISLPWLFTGFVVFILNESPGFAFLRSSADVISAVIWEPASSVMLDDWAFALAPAFAFAFALALAVDWVDLSACAAKPQAEIAKVTTPATNNFLMRPPIDGCGGGSKMIGVQTELRSTRFFFGVLGDRYSSSCRRSDTLRRDLSE